MRIEFSPRVGWALCAYSLLAVLTWFCTSDNVSAQSYCSIPQTIGEAGYPNVGRWESFQRVKVKLYPGHFTGEEQTEIRNVLDEFEVAGATANCSQVKFVEMAEVYFPITDAGVGDPNDTDTLYIYRRSISEMPGDAGGLGGDASLAFNHYKFRRAWLKIREDVTITASKAVFKGTLRHELGHSFWLFDAYAYPCSVTIMCSNHISTTASINECDNYKISTVYCEFAGEPPGGGGGGGGGGGASCDPSGQQEWSCYSGGGVWDSYNCTCDYSGSGYCDPDGSQQQACEWSGGTWDPYGCDCGSTSGCALGVTELLGETTYSYTVYGWPDGMDCTDTTRTYRECTGSCSNCNTWEEYTTYCCTPTNWGCL